MNLPGDARAAGLIVALLKTTLLGCAEYMERAQQLRTMSTMATNGSCATTCLDIGGGLEEEDAGRGGSNVVAGGPWTRNGWEFRWATRRKRDNNLQGEAGPCTYLGALGRRTGQAIKTTDYAMLLLLLLLRLLLSYCCYACAQIGVCEVWVGADPSSLLRRRVE